MNGETLSRMYEKNKVTLVVTGQKVAMGIVMVDILYSLYYTYIIIYSTNYILM